MTDAEAREIIKKVQRPQTDESDSLASAQICLGLTVVSLFAIPFVGFLAGVFAILAATFALMCWLVSLLSRDAKKQKPAIAVDVWDKISSDKYLFPAPSPTTEKLRTWIADIYVQNPGVLPMTQALRLFHLFYYQQRRENAVREAARALKLKRPLLKTKLRELESLGETRGRETALLAVEKLNAQIVETQKTHAEVKAACERLELLVAKIHRTLQVQKLGAEIQHLSRGVLNQSSSSSDVFGDEEWNALESQIAREIETFARLERETDLMLEP